MRIGKPSDGDQKSGSVGEVQPFKTVMNATKGPSAAPQLARVAAPATVEHPKKTPQLTAIPSVRPLPGGVKPLPRGAVAMPAADAKTVRAAGSVRSAARADADAKAEALAEVRAQHSETSRQRYDTRLVDLICSELKAEFGNELTRPQAANSDRPLPAPVPSQPQATVTHIAEASAKRLAELKAASAVRLIEKIEAFVKSQRPGLAITLDGSLGARVEIERLGPKEVALRVVGTNGPPAPEDIGRIREEMRARGLKVGALSVA